MFAELAHDDVAAAVQAVLDDLCVTLGFCLPPDEQHRLRELPPRDAEAFADAVLTAEGMNPHHNKALRQKVQDRAERHLAT